MLASLFRGRWFCRNLCPTGFLAEKAGHLRPLAGRYWPDWPRLNRWIALVAVVSAAAGYPLLLWLDPLSIFNAFFSIWTLPVIKAENLLGIGLLLVLGLSIWRPGAWCYRICPLGYVQEFFGELGGRVRRHVGRGSPPEREINKISHQSCICACGAGTPSSRFLRPEVRPAPVKTAALSGKAANPGRRAFLVALMGGGAAVLLRNLHVARRPMRPPGAAPEEEFKALCVRCGNCIRTCPKRILHAAVNPLDPPGFLAPIVKTGPGYCFEYCKQCTDVCPTRAIRPLTLSEKQQTTIGLAEVNRSTCLAWDKGEYCMICAEYCPYHAIRAVKHNGVNCPEVDPEICRGCGACQVQCPTQPKSIIAYSRPQKLLKVVEI